MCRNSRAEKLIGGIKNLLEVQNGSNKIGLENSTIKENKSPQ